MAPSIARPVNSGPATRGRRYDVACLRTDLQRYHGSGCGAADDRFGNLQTVERVVKRGDGRRLGGANAVNEVLVFEAKRAADRAVDLRPEPDLGMNDLLRSSDRHAGIEQAESSGLL